MSVSKTKPALKEQSPKIVESPGVQVTTQSPPDTKRKMVRRRGFNIHNKYDVLVNQYCQNLQQNIYLIKKINQNDNKSKKQIKQILEKKSKIEEIIFSKESERTNVPINFKIDFDQVRGILIQENRKISYSSEGDTIQVKVDKEALQQMQDLISQLEELYNKRQVQNLKWMEAQITLKQFNYYEDLKEFEAGLSQLVDKNQRISTPYQDQLINKQMLHHWEKYKSLIGNNSYIIFDKIIWDQIYLFEFKFGQMKTLRNQTLSIAKYLSTIISQINSKLQDYKYNQK